MRIARLIISDMVGLRTEVSALRTPCLTSISSFGPNEAGKDNGACCPVRTPSWNRFAVRVLA